MRQVVFGVFQMSPNIRLSFHIQSLYSSSDRKAFEQPARGRILLELYALEWVAKEYLYSIFGYRLVETGRPMLLMPMLSYAQNPIEREKMISRLKCYESSHLITYTVD